MWECQKIVAAMYLLFITSHGALNILLLYNCTITIQLMCTIICTFKPYNNIYKPTFQLISSSYNCWQTVEKNAASSFTQKLVLFFPPFMYSNFAWLPISLHCYNNSSQKETRTNVCLFKNWFIVNLICNSTYIKHKQFRTELIVNC